MGFNKLKDLPDVEEGVTLAGKKFGKSNKDAALKPGGFVPSSQKDIKRYAREAAKRDAERRDAKMTRGEKIKLDLDRNLPFEGFRPKALRRVFAECMDERRKLYLKDKANNPRWAPKMPKYDASEKPRYADNNFVDTIMTDTLSGFSWQHLTKMINAASGESICTKDWTDALRTMKIVLAQAFDVGVDSSGCRYVLLDRQKTLEEWEIEVVNYQRKRKMGNDEEVKKGKLRAKGDEDEAEEETEEEGGEEEAEDDEEEEEEAPKAKSKKKKSAGKNADKDESEESGEDDDEDAEDEPAPKKKKTAKKKKAVVEDEDDEEEESDEDEDGDDTSKSKPKKGSKVAAKKKAVKEEKPVKAKGPVKLKDDTLIKRTAKERPGGGPKGAFYALVTKKGIAYKKLLAAAEAEELPVAKCKTWVPLMIKNGFLTTG